MKVMDPNQNTGSFGAAISNSPQDLSALKQAMQTRGMDVSALDQVSGGSVAGTPPIATPQDITGTSDIAGAQAALPTGVPQTPQAPQEPDSDMQIALKALVGVTKSESKLKQSVLDLRGQGMV